MSSSQSPNTPSASSQNPANTPVAQTPATHTPAGDSVVQPTPRPDTPATPATPLPHRRELGISPVRLVSPPTNSVISGGAAGRGNSNGDGGDGGGGGGEDSPGQGNGNGNDGGENNGNNNNNDDDNDSELEPQRVIWGTNINYDQAVNAFLNFLTTFVPDSHEGDDDALAAEPLYPQILANLNETGETALNIDMAHLRSHDPHWYRALVSYPENLVAVFDHVANDLFGQNHPEAGEAIQARRREALHVRCYNLAAEHVHAMRSINPVHITSMMAVRGMVIRASPVIPDIQKAMYRCSKCSRHVEAPIQDGRIDEPRQCEACQARDSFILLHSRSVFADRQMMRLQEAPEAVPNGETPATFTLVLYDNLVDAAKPGDRVEVTGILRASPVRVNPKMRVVKSVFRTYIDCIHVAVLNNNSLRNNAISVTESPEISTNARASAAQIDGSVSRKVYTPEQKRAREQYFEELACHPDLYQRLSDSLAPSIFGMSDEKKGVLLQLFGGASKTNLQQNMENGHANGAARFRSAINILLVGDPGTSKSQLLQSAHRLAPRGVFTSGRGSSAVGLTAYVTRDPDTSDFVLESGALVLSDRGVCCIDEFDKMSDFARSVLHEAMEQQTVSIAKAGIIATLNARTAVLAAANPVDSRYDPNKSVVENIDLPPTLLSRFDLIYLVLDAPNAEEDRRLAKHIVSLFYRNYQEAGAEIRGISTNESSLLADMDATDGNDSSETGVGVDDGDGDASNGIDSDLPRNDHLDAATLTEYIAYARSKAEPRITSEAGDALVNEYMEMRSSGRGGGAISATPRQLESLIRLSEAYARMHLRSSVEISDVYEASRLVRAALRSAAIDPTTGRIDMDLFALGSRA